MTTSRFAANPLRAMQNGYFVELAAELACRAQSPAASRPGQPQRRRVWVGFKTDDGQRVNG